MANIKTSIGVIIDIAMVWVDVVRTKVLIYVKVIMKVVELVIQAYSSTTAALARSRIIRRSNVIVFKVTKDLFFFARGDRVTVSK